MKIDMIKELLEKSGAFAWRITDTVTKGWEFYFIRHSLDQNRSKDIENISNSEMDTIPQMAVTMIQLVGAFMLMRWFDARLAWALLLITPVMVVIGKLISRRLRKMTLAIRESESKIQMQVQEGVEFNAVLRSLESENWVTKHLNLKQDKLEHEVLRRTRFTAVARFAIGSAFGLGYLLAFVWGGLGLRDGTITFGVMTSFLQLVGQIQHPILTLLGMVPQLVHSTASIDRLDELEAGCGNRERVPDVVLDGRLGVKLENVRFAYANGDREIVADFSHDFKPASKTRNLCARTISHTFSKALPPSPAILCRRRRHLC